MKWMVLIGAIIIRLIADTFRFGIYIIIIPIIWLLAIVAEIVIQRILIGKLNKNIPNNFITEHIKKIYDFSLENKVFSAASIIVLIPGAFTVILTIAMVLIAVKIVFGMLFGGGSKSNSNHPNGYSSNTNYRKNENSSYNNDRTYKNTKMIKFDSGTLIGWKKSNFHDDQLFRVCCIGIKTYEVIDTGLLGVATLSGLKSGDYELYVGNKKITADMIRKLPDKADNVNVNDFRF